MTLTAVMLMLSGATIVMIGLLAWSAKDYDRALAAIEEKADGQAPRQDPASTTAGEWLIEPGATADAPTGRRLARGPFKFTRSARLTIRTRSGASPREHDKL